MFALVAFPPREQWSLADLATQAASRLGAAFRVEAQAADARLVLSAVDEVVVVIPRLSPIPPQLLAGPLSETWYWPDAPEVMAGHGSHLFLALQGDSLGAEQNPVSRSFFLTRVAAELGEAFGYCGVYWDNALMVHSAHDFSAAAGAMRPTQLPLRLWVNFRLAEEPNGTMSLSTTGLEALGEREIEIWGSRAPPAILISWAFNTAHYLLVSRPTIQDGETVATNREQWVRVFRRPSMLDRRRTVYCLELEDAE